MKVILSRKGCDSDFGGMPGIIMPDDRIVYIPIPGDDFETIAYHEVNAGNGLGNLCDVISQVSPHSAIWTRTWMPGCIRERAAGEAASVRRTQRRRF